MAEKKYLRYLKCDFSESEITDRAKELALANRKRSSIEQQKKEIDSDLKAKVEEQNTLIGRLSEQIATGHEYRDVECAVILDTPEKDKKTIVRKDTGEEVAVELMGDYDKQMALDLLFKSEDPNARPGGNEAPTNGRKRLPPPDSIDGETRPPEPR